VGAGDFAFMAQYTILIVDYEPRSVEQLRAALEPAGYHIELAKDGLIGAERFHAVKPDLALVEAMLPKKHGFELCQELKRSAHGQKTPIVIITGVYKGRKYRTQAMHQHGCDAYLEKPIAAEQLIDTIRLLLERSGKPALAAAPAVARPEPGRATVEEEIIGRLDSILSDDSPHPVGASHQPARGPGSKGPRAQVADVIPFESRRSGSLPVSVRRGGAQPALFSRAEIEEVRGVAMPAEDLDEPSICLAPGDDEAGGSRRYPWIAFVVLVVFAAVLLALLY
jgi:CheY-like chemotaxis protein